MVKKPKLLIFFAVWFFIVSIYIFFVTFSFSLYTVTILAKKAIVAEMKLETSINYLKVALKDFPNDPELLEQMGKNKEALKSLKESNRNLKKLKLSVIDIPFFFFYLLTSVLYLIASVSIFKRKKLSIKIIPIALLCSLINLFAMPMYKLIKGADTGFPHYGIFMVIALICYAYTFYYFTSSKTKEFLF